MKLVLRGTISPEDRDIDKRVDVLFKRAGRIRRIRYKKSIVKTIRDLLKKQEV